MNTRLDQEVRQVVAREQHQRLIDQAAYARLVRRLDRDPVTFEERKEGSYMWKRRFVYAIAIGISILLAIGVF
jgi:hypothetical protein